MSQEKIAKHFKISPKMVSKIMHENNIHIRTNREQALKYTVDENFFETIDTEEKAYWLGFLYADGYIVSERKGQNGKCVGLTLSEQDISHLEKFKKSLNFTGNIRKYISKNKSFNTKPYCKIIISSSKLADDLIDKGCFENKTFILKYPTEKQVPLHLQKHFIRGYIDGDGTITFTLKKNKNITDKYCYDYELKMVGTKELLTGIKKAIGKDKCLFRQRFPERNNNNYYFSLGGNKQVLEMLDYLYGDSTIYLDRKYERYINFKQLYKSWKN